MTAHLNMHEVNEFGLALIPGNVNTTRIFGAAIVKPWRTGRRLLFQVVAGAFGASDSITIGFQRRRVGTSTWDEVVENDGTTTLAMPAEVDGGTLENGSIFGEINLETLKVSIAGGSTYDYDAIRLTAVNLNAANVVVGASYAIGNLFKRPAAGAGNDKIYHLQRGTF